MTYRLLKFFRKMAINWYKNMLKMYGYLRIKRSVLIIPKSKKLLEENLISGFGYLSNPSFHYKPTFLNKDILDYRVKIISLKKIVRLFKKISRRIWQIIALTMEKIVKSQFVINRTKIFLILRKMIKIRTYCLVILSHMLKKVI